MKSNKGGNVFMKKRKRRSSSVKLGLVMPLLIARNRENGNSPTESIMWKKRKRSLLDAMKKGKRSTTVEHQR
jgi:hypothetical protein